jgi:beta-lactamase class A
MIMAKKPTKRPNLSAEMLERARAELRGEVAVVADPTPAASAGTPAAKRKVAAPVSIINNRRLPTIEELNAEYHHITRDLRNVAIISLVLFAGIIAAALLLPAVTG